MSKMKMIKKNKQNSTAYCPSWSIYEVPRRKHTLKAAELPVLLLRNSNGGRIKANPAVASFASLAMTMASSRPYKVFIWMPTAEKQTLPLKKEPMASHLGAHLK